MNKSGKYSTIRGFPSLPVLRFWNPKHSTKAFIKRTLRKTERRQAKAMISEQLEA